MKKALITGALGQDGSYLSEYLLSLGYEVWGTIRAYQDGCMSTFSNYVKGVNYQYADMADEVSLDKVIRKCWPDEIYNLAGQVFVPTSWHYPAETFDVNVGGLGRILSVLERVHCDAKVYQASSSEMFGNIMLANPSNHEECFVALNEHIRMSPISPYGVSKYAAHKLVDVYRQKGRYIVSGILFNHESPRRGPEMVTRKITKHVAQWRLGSMETLHLGNITSKRDWGFAGDYVKAMHSMLQQSKPDDYVIGTGEAHSIQDFLEAALKSCTLDLFNWRDHVELGSKAFTRLDELHILVADNSKAKEVLDWEPETSFNQLVSMMVTSDVNLAQEQVTA